jgi:hypothetical protein
MISHSNKKCDIDVQELCKPERLITDELIELLAVKVADKIADQVIQRLEERAYTAVGKTVVNTFFSKILYFIGIGSVALYSWCHYKGWY